MWRCGPRKQENSRRFTSANYSEAQPPNRFQNGFGAYDRRCFLPEMMRPRREQCGSDQECYCRVPSVNRFNTVAVGLWYFKKCPRRPANVGVMSRETEYSPEHTLSFPLDFCIPMKTMSCRLAATQRAGIVIRTSCTRLRHHSAI
jgi:hypothetical protein